MTIHWRSAVLVAAAALGLLACSTAAPAPGPDTAVASDATVGATSLDATQPETAAPDSEPAEVAPPDTAPAETAAAPDVAPVEVAAIDVPVIPDTAPDAADIAADVAVDAKADVEGLPCKPATQTCEGAKLKTCLSKGDGFTLSNCFPGSTCNKGTCVPVENNLIIAFDTSGSMNDAVKVAGANKCQTGYSTWPDCEYVDPKFAGGCTRMGVSKFVFKQALAKIDDQQVRMALFRFPQTQNKFGPSCASGYYTGSGVITGNNDAVLGTTPDQPGWFWNGLSEIMCVPFPPNPAVAIKDAMLLWMDGKESLAAAGVPANPELRPTGSTPIGKTLFYIGEYIRQKVIIDGKPCAADADCANVNYQCKNQKCVDPNRSCRETVLVLFTDGGEANNNTYFGPWVQAKRLSTGLGCQINSDCAPGATCQTVQKCQNTAGTIIDCQADKDCAIGKTCKPATLCLPKESVTGWQCSAGMAPCLPDATSGAAFCASPAVCVQDPRPMLTAAAIDPGTKALTADNSLKSYDGKPFSVKVIVVDISGSVDVKAISASASIAIAGGGKLLGADAGDPEALLNSLDAAFDIKTKKVCGAEL